MRDSPRPVAAATDAAAEPDERKNTMSRLPLIDPAVATGAARSLLDAVGKKLGRVPNMTRAMANSPAVLKAYLDFGGALGASSLSAKTRELIALTVGEVNGCGYCVSAHTAIGGMIGLGGDALVDARRARSDDPRTASVLRFARLLVLQRGLASDADLRDLRAAGVTDGEIAEIVASVALNVFTNWFNHVAETPVDFPAVEALPEKSATAACACRS
jgi:uncharacterized peroxidase-related enzyme